MLSAHVWESSNNDTPKEEHRGPTHYILAKENSGPCFTHDDLFLFEDGFIDDFNSSSKRSPRRSERHKSVCLVS
jgi:hypothetical protein